MHPKSIFLPLSITLLILSGANAKTLQAKTLQDVLSRMDETAASFHGLSAKMKRVEHTAVINDDTTSVGELLMKRTSPNNVKVLVHYSQPDPKDWALEGKTFQLYYPKMNTVDIYDLGKQSNLIDQFLLLGFGTSGKDLAKNYAVTLEGIETINGQPVTKLHLVPKSKEALKYLTAVDLWYSDQGYPVKQKFYQPSGDYQLVNYSNVQINPNLADAQVHLTLPKNVKKEYPQK